MSKLATMELNGQQWVAKQVYGVDRGHSHIVAAALKNKIPFCRRHLIKDGHSPDVFEKTFSPLLSASGFDTSTDFDTLVIVHDCDRDPSDELRELEICGRGLIQLVPRLPNHGYMTGYETEDVYFGLDNALLSQPQVNKIIGQYSFSPND